ncbi:hypothetical protein Indivirus_2_31 [Indivirus ILV1]|uniref:Uncharacterized protein n=1 Tax=Indivirus ILV1 TaxID=1977633 RepID=A0A1V0SD68_9VIRU|nr:hypothetical protein Indivirus_2_31 [Indivirus ILV1]
MNSYQKVRATIHARYEVQYAALCGRIATIRKALRERRKRLPSNFRVDKTGRVQYPTDSDDDGNTSELRSYAFGGRLRDFFLPFSEDISFPSDLFTLITVFAGSTGDLQAAHDFVQLLRKINEHAVRPEFSDIESINEVRLLLTEAAWACKLEHDCHRCFDLGKIVRFGDYPGPYSTDVLDASVIPCPKCFPTPVDETPEDDRDA